jgi:hypothetical protein
MLRTLRIHVVSLRQKYSELCHNQGQAGVRRGTPLTFSSLGGTRVAKAEFRELRIRKN